MERCLLYDAMFNYLADFSGWIFTSIKHCKFAVYVNGSPPLTYIDVALNVTTF